MTAHVVRITNRSVAEADERIRKLERLAAQGDAEAIRRLKREQERTGIRTSVFRPETDMPKLYGQRAVAELERLLQQYELVKFWVLPGQPITGIRKRGGAFEAGDLRYNDEAAHEERPEDEWRFRTVEAALRAVWGWVEWKGRLSARRNQRRGGPKPRMRPLKRVDNQHGIKLYGEDGQA